MKIDAHQHFWSTARGDYGWLTPDKGVIYRDFGPDDLAPLLARHGIERTILVQAAPTVAETHFLLDIARRTPFVAGVVGWVDFEAPDCVEVIAGLARDRLLLGLRPMVQDIADDGWLARLALQPAFEAMQRHALVFDALVLPRHLRPLLEVARRNPDLAIVIDHLAKPPVASGVLHPWAEDIAALAALPQVSCKLSGLVTEAGQDWTPAGLAPYAAHAMAVFGPERLLWGSDWPVVTLAARYDQWHDAAMALIGGLSDAARDAILGGNARRVYLGSRGRL